MLRQKLHKIIEIRRSCLTGKVIWIYKGPSKDAARRAYWRACKKEIERVKRWPETVARHKEAVMRMLSICTANLPITGEMTQEQKAAAKRLVALAEEPMPCDMEFYNHIMECRRRSGEDRKIRRKMRERENGNNRNYDK